MSREGGLELKSRMCQRPMVIEADHKAKLSISLEGSLVPKQCPCQGDRLP